MATPETLRQAAQTAPGTTEAPETPRGSLSARTHARRPRGGHRVSPANVVAAEFLDLLDVIVPKLENDYRGQEVLEAVRRTQSELLRMLQGAKWPALQGASERR